MNIQPIQNNISMQGSKDTWSRRIKQKILDAIPEATAKESDRKLETWKKIDNKISKPAENRAIMGITALVTQPAIDYQNHKVDKETRRVSRNRTIAKILAGTGVGVFVVRGPLYDLITKMTDIKGGGKYSKSLIPKMFLKEISENEKFLKNYRSTLSMFIALLAMCVTNFALDAPLTVLLTNLFNDKEKEVRHE